MGDAKMKITDELTAFVQKVPPCQLEKGGCKDFHKNKDEYSAILSQMQGLINQMAQGKEFYEAALAEEKTNLAKIAEDEKVRNKQLEAVLWEFKNEMRDAKVPRLEPLGGMGDFGSIVSSFQSSPVLGSIGNSITGFLK